MHCNNLRLVLGLGLVRVSSRVRIRIKVRVSVMVRVNQTIGIVLLFTIAWNIVQLIFRLGQG